MIIETFEQQTLTIKTIDVIEKMSTLNRGLDTKVQSVDGLYCGWRAGVETSITQWANIETTSMTNVDISETFSTVKQMYSGVETEQGRTLSLSEISKWKINPEYENQNVRQHAGYAAEVISTAKENVEAKVSNTGMTTYRADDRPDLYKRNDQYVDKIRVDETGKVVETVQTKFVGKNASECLSKLASSKFDKYFSDQAADKIEIPKDYYDEMNTLIGEKISGLEEQLEHVKAEGKTEAIETREAKIARYKQIQEKIEASTVTSQEAIDAVKDPKSYTRNIFLSKTYETIKVSNEVGIKSGLTAAGLSAAVSTVDNIQKYVSGEVTAREAVLDVAKDTGTAGVLGYGTAFVSNTVATAMSQSGHQLISSLGNTGVPAVVISVGIQSFDSVVDYAQGEISGEELAYKLGDSTARATGGMVGSMATAAAGAKVGAIVGSVVPGAGTAAGAAVGAAAGFGLGVVGGMIGTAVAAEAYATAVELGGEGADVMEAKVQDLAEKTIEIAKVELPDQVGNVKSALNEFMNNVSLPIHI